MVATAAPRYRTFGGKRYVYHSGWRTRAKATTEAKLARKGGWLARVVSVPGIDAWFVYAGPRT